MSQISAIAPCAANFILKGANFCHKASGISRSLTKYLVPACGAMAIFSYYQIYATVQSHNENNHSGNLKEFGKCSHSQSQCEKYHGIYKKSLIISLIWTNSSAAIYILSVGTQYLSHRAIEWVNQRSP